MENLFEEMKKIDGVSEDSRAVKLTVVLCLDKTSCIEEEEHASCPVES